MMRLFKKRKYCCDWFSAYHQKTNDKVCIRVVKSLSHDSSSLLEVKCAEGDLGKSKYVEYSNIPYRFFLMYPYEKYDTLLPGMMLSYCLSCGVNLFVFYAKRRNIDNYVDEIEE